MSFSTRESCRLRDGSVVKYVVGVRFQRALIREPMQSVPCWSPTYNVSDSWT
jgi:hypothetical protein